MAFSPDYILVYEDDTIRTYDSSGFIDEGLTIGGGATELKVSEDGYWAISGHLDPIAGGRVLMHHERLSEPGVYESLAAEVSNSL
jgi:hypothetical protein